MLASGLTKGDKKSFAVIFGNVFKANSNSERGGAIAKGMRKRYQRDAMSLLMSVVQ